MEPLVNKNKRKVTYRSGPMIMELIAEYKASKCSVNEFCDNRGLKSGTFYGWLNRYKNKSNQACPAFVPITIKEDRLSERKLFAEYKGLKLYHPMSVEFFKALID